MHRLGVHFGPKKGSKIELSVLRPLFEAPKLDLGPIWAPYGPHMDPQTDDFGVHMEPKKEPKIIQKRDL